MRKFSLQDWSPTALKVCILIFCALTLTHSTAQIDYFFLKQKSSWDAARNHCQVCFKDLVTLTSSNIQNIVDNLNSTDYWIGLRKNSNLTNNSTGNLSSNSTILWTNWANGDPLIFQNWYPGWPVFKSSLPKQYCCSCSCTCTAATTPTTGSYSTEGPTDELTPVSTDSVSDVSNYHITDQKTLTKHARPLRQYASESITDVNSFTATDQNFTKITSTQILSSSSTQTNIITSAPTTTSMPPVQGECERSPFLESIDPETDERFIEDSCVVMLSFGAWVEKHCSELLPFICYEDRFMGPVNVTDITTSSANLTWLPGPSGISHYRVEVKGDEQWEFNQTNVTYHFLNLTAGNHYSIQVFPVKCERDLNPQNVTFYTKPNKVKNLIVTEQKTTTISLSWDKPDGNVDLYKVNEAVITNETESAEVSGLIPGSPFTFTIIAGVKDESEWSEESHITAYTKPNKVSNLRAVNNTNDLLVLQWELEGNATHFRVIAMNETGLFNQVVKHNSNQTQEVRVTGLPAGTKLTFKVTALANQTLEGDVATIFSFTAPGPISNLQLETKHYTLTANWTILNSNYSYFIVTLKLGKRKECSRNTTENHMYFSNLRTSANYTVTVSSVSGDLEGPPVSSSKFTLPGAPTNAEVTSFGKTHISFKWKPPVNANCCVKASCHLEPSHNVEASYSDSVSYNVSLSSNFCPQNISVHVGNGTSYTFENLTSGVKYDFEVRTVTDTQQSDPLVFSHSTEPDYVNISLAMLCSSSVPLLCEDNASKDSVFKKLNETLYNELKDHVFWKLEKQESENIAA